jgi:hypothetical protein
MQLAAGNKPFRKTQSAVARKSSYLQNVFWLQNSTYKGKKSALHMPTQHMRQRMIRHRMPVYLVGKGVFRCGEAGGVGFYLGVDEFHGVKIGIVGSQWFLLSAFASLRAIISQKDEGAKEKLLMNLLNRIG